MSEQQVSTQAEYDAAIVAGEVAVLAGPAFAPVVTGKDASHMAIRRSEVSARIEAQESATPTIEVGGDAKPVIVALQNSAPVIRVSDNATPVVEFWGGSSGRVEARGTAKVKVVVRDRATPTIVASDRSEVEVQVFDSAAARIESTEGARVVVTAHGGDSILTERGRYAARVRSFGNGRVRHEIIPLPRDPVPVMQHSGR